ncbi:MAG: M23 family metallopeptidase, partial [Pseudomonadota bacterium]|nr:M23 family metallopeptidase [Pseudomonadota bacterium]
MRILVAALLLASPLEAQTLSLSLPLDCSLGDTCHIQQYVDRDPGPGARDVTCGALSYDGHKGTDFALATLAQMEAGVDVLAAAPGVVSGIRNDMADRLYRADQAAETEGRECGNGVVLRHDNGYETQYCHMRQGSVRVASGDRVAQGDVLGQVGLSGLTQFPHLHLSVRRDGAVADPFDAQMTDACDDGEQMWQTPLPYEGTGLLDAAFAPAVPQYDAVQNGTAAQGELPPTAGGLVLFGFAYGGLQGDVMVLEITGPDGPVSSQRATVDKQQARYFRASGKRLTLPRWPAGSYVGRVTLERDGQIVATREVTTTIR